MTTYRITNTASGHCLGNYQGDSPEAAIAAMLADAGCSDDADPALEAVEVRNWSRLPSGDYSLVGGACSAVSSRVLGTRGRVIGVSLTAGDGRAATATTTRPSLDHLDWLAAKLELV